MAHLRIGFCHDPAALNSAAPASGFASCDVLIMPELVDGGYAALSAGAIPHRLNDPLISLFRSASRSLSLCLVAGSTCLHEDSSSPTNTSLVFQDGRLVNRYDKIHLFKPTGDHRYFTRGSAITTFVVRGRQATVRAGVVICYDLRFPELIRRMALDGMKILFVPARWPKVRDEAWQTLLRARAIENQIFVVGCNAPDSEGGHSYAFDPLGRRLFAGGIRSRGAVRSVLLPLGALTEAQRAHRNLREAVILKKTVIPRRLTPPTAPHRHTSKRKSTAR